MNREEYIKLLKIKLKRLPKDEFNKAIDYFEEYFDEAGTENVAQAIEDLGSVQEAADKIVRDFAIDNTINMEARKDVKKGFTGTWIAILAICASPIAAPLLIVLVMVLVLLLLCVLLVLFCLGLAGITMIISVPMLIVASFTMLAQDFPNFLICLGEAFVLGGLGSMIAYGSYILMRNFLSWVVVSFGNIVKKKGNKDED